MEKTCVSAFVWFRPINQVIAYMTGSNHITWWRIQILQTFGELHWELIHELSMKIKLDGWCWHTYTFQPYWKGDSFKMDFSTFQDNVNPPEVTRVLPSMEELCTSPVPKNLPTQIPHSNNLHTTVRPPMIFLCTNLPRMSHLHVQCHLLFIHPWYQLP